MKVSEREKYLGDIIDKSGSLQATIESRKSKGQGIISEILSILSEIPLGKHKIVVAMKLREVMLLNGILYNSEAWHGITKKQIKTLESIDEDLLRGILKAHSKTPKEFLYLETGATPIQWILRQRRINFLKHILSKDNCELVKKVYMAQKDLPNKGDFEKLVEKDLEDINITQTQVESFDRTTLKKILKKHATNAAFDQLRTIQAKHSKVKHIFYESLQLQPYLKSENICSQESHALTALRSRCVKSVRMNFPKMFKDRTHCPLKCDREKPHEDTQDHLLKCNKNMLTGTKALSINQAFGNIVDQEEIAKAICKIIRRRATLLDQLEDMEKENQSTGA